MSNAGIIDQLWGVALLVLPLLVFTLATIYRYFVKGLLSPIQECLTFVSAQSFKEKISALLIKWAKEKDNKAKIASCSERIRLGPDNLALYKERARLYANESKPKQRQNALNDYEYVFKNNPDDREAFNYLLDDALKHKQFEQAKSFIDIAQYPDRDIIQLTFGVLIKHNQKIDHKIETANFYLNKRLINVKEAYIDIIRYSLGLTADFQVKAFSNMTDYPPEYSEAFNNLACWYEKLALYPAVANNYRLAVAFFASADTWHRLGILLTKHLNQHEAAKACYDRAIELDPNDAVVHVNLGYLLTWYFKQYEAARACYEKAIELGPNDVIAYLNLGILLGECPYEPALAVECFLKVLALAPRHPQANVLRAKIAEYKPFIDEQPNDPLTWEAESVLLPDWPADWPTLIDTEKNSCGYQGGICSLSCCPASLFTVIGLVTFQTVYLALWPVDRDWGQASFS